MPPIKTIIFDIGDVLLNIHPEKTFEFWANITGLSLNKLQKSIPGHVGFLQSSNEFKFHPLINGAIYSYEGVQKLIESLEKFNIPINNSVLI